MASETAEAPTSEAKTDGQKSDNVKGAQVAAALVKRQEALAAGKPTPETVVQVAKVTEETAKLTGAAPESTASEAKAEPAKTEEAKTEALSQSTQERKLEPWQQEIIDKRIGEVTKERKALEAQVELLQQKLDKVITTPPPPKVEPTPDNPLANINDPIALQNELKTAREIRRWAQEQLDRDDVEKGVSAEVDGKTQTYSKQQLKAVVRNVERMIEDHIPQRANFLAQRDQAATKAAELFDWLKDPASPEFQAYQRYMSDSDLAKKPNSPIIAALLVKGESDLQRELKNKGTKVVTKTERAPSSQTAMGAAPGAIREASATTAIRELDQVLVGLKKKGQVSVKDVGRFLAEKSLHR